MFCSRASNQYGAVPATASNNPIQKAMDMGGEEQLVGGGADVVDDVTEPPVMKTTDDVTVDETSTANDWRKKGIMEKIKEKLPGTHRRHHHKKKMDHVN
ncbi:dehydrin Xero 1-like [Senna tora]|uniref:Dehydrin Xero 1-like n=1 Tax=Senna tora TaxID=362788 RepID=A0A834W3E4_9FABA|nr:dehydrin Xero 1-like [Senna tora]